MDLITMVLACSLYTDNSITNAIVQVGSKNNPLTVTSAQGEQKVFKTQSQAVSYANSELNQGHNIDIGLMQIPSRWLHEHNLGMDELFAPCKNIVVATQILNNAAEQCSDLQANQPIDDLKACTLSVYKTGDPQAGLDYAHTVLDYANAHSFTDIVAEAKKKNPKEFKMLPHAPEKKDKPLQKPKVIPASDQDSTATDNTTTDTSVDTSVNNPTDNSTDTDTVTNNSADGQQ